MRPYSDLLRADNPETVFFIKTHALGNDFVLVDGRAQVFRPQAASIARICDRYRGIGGDQLLVVEQPTRDDADILLRIYNIDGAEAQTCFNATRCTAALWMQENHRQSVVIETLGGLIEARQAGEGMVSLILQPAVLDWQLIPLAAPLNQHGGALNYGPLQEPVAVNMGNPHLVYFTDDYAAIDVPLYAHSLQNSPFLPEQANVGVAQILAQNSDTAHLQLVVYERPGILTQACGSGACAAAVAARISGLTQARNFLIDMPGGQLRVALGEDESIILTGGVSVAFYGIIPHSLLNA